MTQYKHYPYQSWFKWVTRPRQRHMVDALERRPDAFRGHKGKELEERLNMIEVWLRVRAALIVLLSFSVVVTIVTWTIRLLGGFPGGGFVLSLVEAVGNVSSTLSGVLGLAYVLTLRTLGQLEMDALLLLPSHWSEESDGQPEGGPAAGAEDARPRDRDDRVPMGTGAPRRASH